MRERLRGCLFVASLDTLLGLNYFLLGPSYFTAHGFTGPKHIMPIPLWGIAYLLLAAGVLLLKGDARAVWAATVGVGLNILFALAFGAVFAQGLLTSQTSQHTSGGFAILLTGWATRHYFLGRKAS